MFMAFKFDPANLEKDEGIEDDTHGSKVMKNFETLTLNYKNKNRSNTMGNIGSDLSPLIEERKQNPQQSVNSISTDDEADLSRAAMLIQGKFRAKKLSKGSKNGNTIFKSI